MKSLAKSENPSNKPPQKACSGFQLAMTYTSVGDPEPDPHVFGPPDPDPLVRGTDPDQDPSLFS
jgi:hypothetical protein